MSAPGRIWLRLAVSSVAIIGLGYGIMKATIPTPEETYAAMAPDLRRKVDANRAARLSRENAAKAQENAQSSDPDSQKPIWANKPQS